MNYSNKVKELNPCDTPMVDTHAYKWMDAGGWANNRIQCKVNYLRSLGFRRGIDSIDNNTIRLLNYISDHRFYVRMKDEH